MEWQEQYRLRYKGRKGRKQLQAITAQIEALQQETGNVYETYEEWQFLMDRLPDPEIRLYFMKYYRDLNAMWQGVQTYGLLRLAGKWIRQKQIEELTQPDIDEMLESLLPAREWTALTQPIQPQEGA